MLELAVQANLPLIVVQTDDLLYVEEVLGAITGKKNVVRLTEATPAASFSPAKTLFYTLDEGFVEPHMAVKMENLGHSLIVVNAPPKGLAFNAGAISPPDTLVKAKVSELLTGQSPQSIAKLLPTLRGLSLKQVVEVVLLSIAAYGGPLKAEAIRMVRGRVGPTISGLVPLPTTMPFYDPPETLATWVKDQGPYLLDPKHPQHLRPRGILLGGPPGTGKTSAAKYIAASWGIPLYRLDIATTLSRYIGESEARLMSSLDMVDKEEPCVVLFDEVEKALLTSEGDSAVISRMLSQLLWWLQEHTSRVFTVMTTNNLKALPKELYREGRVDMVLEAPLLSAGQATQLAHQIWKSLSGGKVDLKQLQTITEVIKQVSQANHDSPGYSHAWVRQLVIDVAKSHHWI